ncbi:MAG: hypothetical protein AAFR70_15095, partial [Pseudomonadota bacterium]
MTRCLRAILLAAIVFAAFTTVNTKSAHAACVVGVVPTDVLWIRSGPGAGFRKVGAIPFDACGVRVFWGECRSRGRWCPVNYRGITGWSFVRYL